MNAAPEKPEQGLPVFVAEQLKQLIYSGELKPGERLNEAALALRMGTSRGPVREAIRMLTGLGLVTAVLNRGVFVRQMSVREMLELYDLRALVFGFAAERATDHVAESHKAQFEQLLQAMDVACETENANLYYELNLQFHALVLLLANNQRAQAAYDDIIRKCTCSGASTSMHRATCASPTPSTAPCTKPSSKAPRPRRNPPLKSMCSRDASAC
jgi:DNA-binding GntR family transcriptional regulator